MRSLSRLRSEAGSSLIGILILIPLISVALIASLSRTGEAHRLAFASYQRSSFNIQVLRIQHYLINSTLCHQRLLLAGGVVPPITAAPTIVGASLVNPGNGAVLFPLAPAVPVDGLIYNLQYEASGDIFNVPPRVTNGAYLPPQRAGRTVRYQMGRLIITAQRSLERQDANYNNSRLGGSLSANANMRQQIPILMIANDTNPLPAGESRYRCTTRSRDLYLAPEIFGN